MKVSQFITVYNARTKHNLTPSAESIMDAIKDLIKPLDYVPYDRKLEIIDKTLQQASNSAHQTADRYRFFVCNLISLYTSLECNVKDFDTLSEAKLIDPIIGTFESEFSICNNLMQMCISDLERR